MRFLFLVLNFVFLSCICQAAEVAPIGRLFSTPAERAKLDRLRQSAKHGEQIQLTKDPIIADVPAIVEEPVREQFSLDG